MSDTPDVHSTRIPDQPTGSGLLLTGLSTGQMRPPASADLVIATSERTPQVGPQASEGDAPGMSGNRLRIDLEREADMSQEKNEARSICPTCGRFAVSTVSRALGLVVTANHVCQSGHMWETRWVVAA